MALSSPLEQPVGGDIAPFPDELPFTQYPSDTHSHIFTQQMMSHPALQH